MKTGTKPALEDFCAVTSYFNPQHYETRLQNYKLFREALRRSGIRCLTVECAFGNDRFELTEKEAGDRLIQLRASAVTWQHERLLNVAIQNLPASFRKVAWIDCDLLFQFDDWALRAAEVLDRYPLVQLFAEGVRLPRDYAAGNEYKPERPGFARVVHAFPKQRALWCQYGLAGFAWAARRSVVEKHGLYDACMWGGNDHLMVHAWFGDFQSECVTAFTGFDTPFHRHYLSWAKAAFRDVRGRLTWVPGKVFHLWHGEIRHRGYYKNCERFRAFNFDPCADVRIDAEGCWAWSSSKHKLHSWTKQIFAARLEDGTRPSFR